MQLFERKKKQPTINLTPLIDILFLLIIFFVVSSRLIGESGIKLELPQSGQSEQANPQLTTLSIAKKGELFLNEQAIARQALIPKLQEIALAKPQQPVILNVDENVAHFM